MICVALTNQIVKKILDYMYKDAEIYMERKYNIYLEKFYNNKDN